MPRILPGAGLFPALLLFFLAACGERDRAASEGPEPLAAATLAEALEAGEARLAVLYVPSSGFAYEDGEGRLTGVTVELMRRFGEHAEEALGLDVSLEFVREEAWATFYERVRRSRGGVFGIGNVTITEERREELAFSPPYLHNVAILMTHEDVPELGSMDEIAEAFRGMAGLVYPGTLHERRLERLRAERFPGMATDTVRTNDELVGRVASGEGYFGFIDVYNYWRAMEEGRPLRRHPVADDASESFGVIMPLDSDWDPVIDDFFEEGDGLMEAEWYHELLRTHLGEELAGLLTGTEAGTQRGEER